MAGLAQPRPAAGLGNLGNTCYFNATVQMLAHCKQVLVRLVLDGGAEAALEPPDAAPLSHELRRLLTRVWLANASPTAPDGLPAPPAVVVPAELLRRVAQARVLHDSVHAQNDAHELYGALVDRASAEMAAARRRAGWGGPSEAPAARPPSARLAALEAGWAAARRREEPLMLELFHGQLSCATACRGCGHAEPSDDVFSSLALALPAAQHEPTSAQRCLEAHLRPEDVAGWRCPACGEAGAGVPAVRRAALWRAPSVLVLCLKRFRGADEAVLRTPVRADPDLDLSALAAPGSPAAALLASGARYRLAAAVCHAGSQGGGHYWACARLPGTDAWHVYNDSHAHALPGGADAVPPDAAYMLAYELVRGGVAPPTTRIGGRAG